MKAIVIHEFGGPEVLRYEETGDLKPAAGQVLVRIKAAGVNPVETYVRSGAYARKPQLPYTPGSDGAGVVIGVDEDVTRYKEGDRVYSYGSLSGTYAEQALCLESQLFPLPDNVGFTQGAALGIPYGTAYRALFQKALALRGETVLIHGGSGGVGTAAIQLAHAAGMKVIATAGSPKGLDLVKAQGADLVVDHTVAGHTADIPGLNGGNNVDIILEMLANANLAEDLKILAFKGRIIIGSRGAVEIDPRLLMAHDALVSGMLLFNTGETELEIIHADLAKGLKNGSLAPVIGAELPLKEAAGAHRKIMSPGAYGKIVLVP